MIIDCHTHIDRANNKDWKVNDLLASMEDAKIDYSIVIGNHKSIPSLNQLQKLIKTYPNLRAIGNVDFDTFNKKRLQELINGLEQKVIVGVKIYPGYQNFYPFDRKLYPLYAYLEKNNYPLMVHTGVLMVGCQGYLEQAQPLHLDRIARDFQKLKIVMAHLGNPWLIDAVGVMWKNPNVYADLSGFFTEFEEIDELELHNFLNRMNDVDELINYKRFIFGTDWPLYSQKEYLEAIKRLSYTNEERELVFWKNAAELFKITT